MTRSKTYLLPALAVACLMLGTPLRAGALVITQCGTLCSSSCELGANIECGSGQNGVTLFSGASLDMKNHYIWCDAAAGDSCGTAVLVNGAGSSVFTSVNATYSTVPAGILGTWARGVDCTQRPNSGVSGLLFRGFFGDAAIYNCQAALNNTITGLPNPVSLGPDPATGVFAEWPKT